MSGLMLVRAIRNGASIERIETLAEKAVEEKSLNQRNNEGQNNAGSSALEAALERAEDHPEEGRAILHLLVDHGADASTLDSMYVEMVSKLGDQALMDKLIARGMKTDIQNSFGGHTPLMRALVNYTELLSIDEPEWAERFAVAIRTLLQNNPEVELHRMDGMLPLHMALGSTMNPFLMEILPQLITPNTINHPTNDGMTPLMIYAERRMFQVQNDEVDLDTVVSFLLERGANVLERNNEGQTACDLARARNNEELARILQQKEREAKEAGQGALVQRGRQGHQQRVPPALARRITNFLGGKRKTRKGRKAKTQKGRKARTHKGRKTHARRRM